MAESSDQSEIPADNPFARRIYPDATAVSVSSDIASNWIPRHTSHDIPDEPVPADGTSIPGIRPPSAPDDRHTSHGFC